MELGLAGKVALITGSYRGTGAGIAASLAEEGATVLVHGFETGQPHTCPHHDPGDIAKIRFELEMLGKQLSPIANQEQPYREQEQTTHDKRPNQR